MPTLAKSGVGVEKVSAEDVLSCRSRASVRCFLCVRLLSGCGQGWLLAFTKESRQSLDVLRSGR